MSYTLKDHILLYFSTFQRLSHIEGSSSYRPCIGTVILKLNKILLKYNKNGKKYFILLF